MKASVALCLLMSASSVFGECLVKNGEKIAFIGDSITEFGNWPAGYINMVIRGLEFAGVRAEKIPVGHSAETSADMERRFDRDVVAAKPQWVTISCGVNDPCRLKDKKTGKVDYAAYRKNVRSMLDKAQAAWIRPVLLTPTLRPESKLESSENAQILELCAFLREEAKARQIPLADLNARMRETLAKMPPAKGTRLTRDDIHMNFDGNAMMASGVLEALGVRVTSELAATWRDLPDGHTFYQEFSWDEIQKVESAKKPGEDRKHCAERLLRTALAAGVRPPAPKPPKKLPDDKGKAPEIVFLGDRVMAFGSGSPSGWVDLVVNGLAAAEGRHVVSKTMAWWLKDQTAEIMTNSVSLAAAKPKRAVIMLGSREMRPHGSKAAENLALVKERLVKLIDTFVAAKTEVVVVGQPAMARPRTNENPLESADSRNVVAFNAWLKGECEKRGAKFVDLYAEMMPGLKARAGKAEQEPFGEGWFVGGWYHMILNFRGQALTAESVLKAFGAPPSEEVKTAWRKLPHAVEHNLGLSLNEWDALEAKAKECKMDAPRYASAILKESLR